MPAWSVHIVLAKKLKDKYRLSDDFIVGNVMPDVPNGFVIPNISTVIDYSTTHYNFEGPNKLPKINVAKFLEEYQEKLNNPIVLGVYIHLLTDSYFNEYFYENHVGKNRTAILNDGSISDEIVPWKLKQEEFNKFGDYLIHLEKLKCKINKLDKTEEYIQALNYSLSSKEIDIVIDKINSFVTKGVNEIPDYRMFKEEELEKLFKNCYHYLEEKLNNIIEI